MRSSIHDFKQIEQLAHLHVIVVDDRQQRVAIRQHGVERLADLAHFERDVVAGDAEVKIPIEVEVIVEVMPHERPVGELLIQKLVEEGRDFGGVYRLVEIRRDAGEVDLLAEVVVASLLETLQENRHAFLRGRLPIVINQAPKIVGQRILFAEIDVDHRQHRPLALVEAGEEKRDDSVLDIIRIEIGRNGRAKPRHRGQHLFRQRRLRGVGVGLLDAANHGGGCAASHHAECCRACLQDGSTFQVLPFHRFLRLGDDCDCVRLFGSASLRSRLDAGAWRALG